jgi:hypothetical protein
VHRRILGLEDESGGGDTRSGCRTSRLIGLTEIDKGRPFSFDEKFYLGINVPSASDTTTYAYTLHITINDTPPHKRKVHYRAPRKKSDKDSHGYTAYQHLTGKVPIP